MPKGTEEFPPALDNETVDSMYQMYDGVTDELKRLTGVGEYKIKTESRNIFGDYGEDEFGLFSECEALNIAYNNVADNGEEIQKDIETARMTKEDLGEILVESGLAKKIETNSGEIDFKKTMRPGMDENNEFKYMFIPPEELEIPI